MSNSARILILLTVVASLAGCRLNTFTTGEGGYWERPDGSTADVQTRDASVMPDVCVPAAEVCDGQDNDCNDQVDEGFDLQNDPENCGECGERCDFDNALGRCVEGDCVLEGCFPGYWNTNGNDTDGCEYACFETNDGTEACDAMDNNCDGQIDEDFDLFNDSQNCGSCGFVCNFPFAAATCVAATCVIGSCDAGFWDVNGDPLDGCEYGCQQTNGGVEICDGIDNDCDGLIDADDNLGGDPSMAVTCYGDPDGLCADPSHAGQTECINATVVCTGANVLRQYETLEVCDGVDEDCDGVVDNHLTDTTGSSCGTSAIYPCSMGTWECQAGGNLVCVGDVGPGTETCNGIDDDCDGTTDNNLTGMGQQCWSFGPGDTPPSPPAGISSPCQAGVTACVGGAPACQSEIGPQALTDDCDEDTNCDGTYDGLFNLQTDVSNCGVCGNDCRAGALNSNWSCVNGTCQFDGCLTNYYDLDNDQSCEYACFFQGAEVCNGLDDDCDGDVDSADSDLVVPAPSDMCGTSPIATAPECTSNVSVTCNNGSWGCTFPANVCNPDCANAVELCDTLDNNCDGSVNETFPTFGQSCNSDDGLPYPGHGACQGQGTYYCDTTTSVACDAVKQTCASPPSNPTQTCDEECDGIDNDCDGLVDEPFSDPGTDDGSTAWDESAFYVMPAVTQVSSTRWIMTYEVSRPTASATSAGSGNGYWCTGTGCPGGVTPAPGGVTLDQTPACSVPGRLPWFNVTPAEVEQTCYNMGGFICALADWQTACEAGASCDWGYNPTGTCTTPADNSSVYCNIDDFDFDGNGTNGNQDGLLVTASLALANCWASWAAQTDPDIFDITGNLREITKSGSNVYPLMGGSFLSPEYGATCDFDFFTVQDDYQGYETGFRCCFDTDPR